ncbi:MAG TPA: glycosyltransferase [Humisphaera sp.]|nr:glycosyltransferase [Humisphaera sp.]
MSLKSVLYIGAGAPWVGGAGYLVRQRMFLRALAEIADLTLAMFDLPENGGLPRPQYAKKLTPLPKLTRADRGGAFRLLADWVSPTPRSFVNYRADGARRIVAGLKPAKFDAVFAFRIDFAHFAGVLGHPRLLLDIDDPEHVRGRRQLAATQAGGDWRTRRDLDKLERFEKRAARGAVASFVCQENDRDIFDPKPIVIPNCVDVPPACPPRRATEPRIIFIGNFAGVSPNTDALGWFLDEIWPLIRAAVPACEFHVIGKVTGDLERRVLATQGAVAVGFVENLGLAMSEASLSVAPIRYGTGTRVKIIESFALGCPVVSTTLGCEGIDAKPDERILIGDTPAAFADYCVRLLGDPGAQTRIAAAAFELAASQYSEEKRRHELVEILSSLIK